MKTVVFTAQAFGFGPVSKMLVVSENIKDVRKIFFGTGVAYDLAQLHSFDEIHRLGPGDEKEILSLLTRSDLFVNVMEFSISDLVKRQKCPYFIIDILLWFWPEKPQGVDLADIYFCQDFFGSVEPKVKEYHLTNAQVTGPIISTDFVKSGKIDQVTINFGGLECNWIEVGKNTNYPFMILKNVLPILKNHFSQILVTGRERVMQMCREMFGEDERVKFQMLDQKKMLSELYRSQALFTAPGSEIFWDAYDKLPIFCLLPQNNSNFRQLNHYIRSGAITHYLHWPEVSNFDLPEQCTNDEEEIKSVLKIIEKFGKEEIGQKALRDKVQKFLEVKDSWPELIARQRKPVTNVTGTETIVKAIKEVLDNSKIPI